MKTEKTILICSSILTFLASLGLVYTTIINNSKNESITNLLWLLSTTGVFGIVFYFYSDKIYRILNIDKLAFNKLIFIIFAVLGTIVSFLIFKNN